MTVAQLITALQQHDPNAVVCVMPYRDPELMDEVVGTESESVLVHETRYGRRVVWRSDANVGGKRMAAVSLSTVSS